jgi:hypothetical protein
MPQFFDFLYGGTGNDQIHGEAGDDSLSLGSGNDIGIGGIGLAWMLYGAGGSPVSTSDTRRSHVEASFARHSHYPGLLRSHICCILQLVLPGHPVAVRPPLQVGVLAARDRGSQRHSPDSPRQLAQSS